MNARINTAALAYLLGSALVGFALGLIVATGLLA